MIAHLRNEVRRDEVCGRPRYEAKLLDVGRRSSRGFPLSSFSAERTLMCGSSSWRVSWARTSQGFNLMRTCAGARRRSGPLTILSRAVFLWLRGTLRSNLAVEQCLSHLTRVVSPKSTTRPRMLTMRRHDPKQCYTHRAHLVGNRHVGTRVSRARKGSRTGRQQVRQNAQSLDILSKSFATDVFKGTILKHDVSCGDGKENQNAQETNPEGWSALRST